MQFLRTSEESHVGQLNSDETVASNGLKVKKKKSSCLILHCSGKFLGNFYFLPQADWELLAGREC